MSESVSLTTARRLIPTLAALKQLLANKFKGRRRHSCDKYKFETQYSLVPKLI